MAYITVTGICLTCKKLFCFHPNKVPSLKGEPICKECIDKANIIRKEKGMTPITYAKDAYEVGQDENEIDWGH